MYPFSFITTAFYLGFWSNFCCLDKYKSTELDPLELTGKAKTPPLPSNKWRNEVAWQKPMTPHSKGSGPRYKLSPQ